MNKYFRNGFEKTAAPFQTGWKGLGLAGLGGAGLGYLASKMLHRPSTPSNYPEQYLEYSPSAYAPQAFEPSPMADQSMMIPSEQDMLAEQDMLGAPDMGNEYTGEEFEPEFMGSNY